MKAIVFITLTACAATPKPLATASTSCGYVAWAYTSCNTDDCPTTYHAVPCSWEGGEPGVPGNPALFLMTQDHALSVPK